MREVVEFHIHIVFGNENIDTILCISINFLYHGLLQHIFCPFQITANHFGDLVTEEEVLLKLIVLDSRFHLLEARLRISNLFLCVLHGLLSRFLLALD